MSDPDITATVTRVVYENRWMRVREDAIQRRDGSTGIYGVVEMQDFVLVVPQHEDGSVHLVQQFRYPVGARFWEFPQGMWGPPGADMALAARHELAEETGLEAAELRDAGELIACPGTMTQRFRVFLARGLTQGPMRLEIEEQDLIARRFPRGDLERMFRDGEIKDSVSLAAWGLLLLKGWV